MSHIYLITKTAELQQAQMRNDAERGRISMSIPQSQTNRPTLLKKMMIILSILIFMAILISPVWA